MIMAKLIIILVAALFLASTIAEASIYRTTTVTTTYETEDVSSKCKQEMQQHSLSSCRDLMRKFMPPWMLMTAADDDKEQQQPPQECCNQLGNVRTECRCDLVRQMMMDVKFQSHRGWETPMPREMVRCGERLTQMCGLSPHSCTITQKQLF